MFVRSETDKRRVLIIDVSHLFYKYAYGSGAASNLSATIMVEGQPVIVNTAIPALTIKQIHRWSKGGSYPTVVCFDSFGSNKCRKAYFTKLMAEQTGQAVTSGTVYKGSRTSQNNSFYDSINLTKNLLMQGGVTVLSAEKYEADDLIKATVDKAKTVYPNLPIDIITGDQDFLPLVDDQVSVFLSSVRSTWAAEKENEKNHYVQITPSNYQAYVECLTDFNKLVVPYNTVLLKKLLRGKKADDIPGYPKLTPTKYNKIVESMIQDGYDMSSIFRYGTPEAVICNKITGMPLPIDKISEYPDNVKIVKYMEPKELTKICKTLSNYVEPDVITHVRNIYNGINLNGAFCDLGEAFNRRPAKISAEIKGYDEVKLQQTVSILKINLPIL